MLVPVLQTGFRQFDGNDLNNAHQALGSSSASGITALAGGGQTGATPLTAAVNEVHTVATLADSVLLPPAIVGQPPVWVINNAANGLAVFPSGSDQITPNTSITAGSAGASVTLATVKIACFVVFKAGNWKEFLTA